MTLLIIPFSDLAEREEQLVEISRQAYLEDQCKQALKNEIFKTESQSEDGDWCQINDILSNKAKAQIQQARRKIKRAAARETSKKINSKGSPTATKDSKEGVHIFDQVSRNGGKNGRVSSGTPGWC